MRAIPGTRAAAAFSPKTSEVFKEEHEVAPVWNNIFNFLTGVK